MGQKVAPTYVSLVTAYLELKLHQETEKEYGTENKNYILKNWKRFLDDCFIPWNLKIASLDHFHNLLNNLHPRIKFTKEWSEKEINFLDVTVIKNTNGKVTTDVFYKATDSFNYVNFKSGHPRHTKINIPFNLARRIRTIVSASDKEKTTKRMNHLNNILRSKEYPPDLITSVINKAKDIPQGELRKVKAKTQDKNTLAFVSTYNPHNPNIFPMIKNTLPILRQSNKLSKVVDNIKIINSKIQPPNLKKILTRARFLSDESTPTIMVTKCTDSRCGTCEHLQEGNNIILKPSNYKFNVKTPMYCGSKSVIYCITCCGCQKQYIGETGNLRARVTVHKEHIKYPSLRMMGVSEHIANCAKEKRPQFKIFPFYKENSYNRTIRENKQDYFIAKFDPELNKLKLTRNGRQS